MNYEAIHLGKSVARKIFHVDIKTKRVGKNRLIASEKLQQYCIERITAGDPFMMTRFGSVEATFFFQYLGYELGAIKDIPEKHKKRLCENAGFFPFPDNTSGKQYVDVMKEAAKAADVLFYWETGFQKYLVENFFRENIVLTYLDNLQPCFNMKEDRIWTEALRGKKVLMIHPFAETIKKQYARRELLWEDQRILPDFELHVIRAVQTIAGTRDDRFATWFEALEYMYTEAMKVSFDIAIIACGAYGMPLAAMLKRAGKQAIHWGGMSQIWMGIKGARWDDNARVNCFYNEAWVRPSTEETPKEKRNVEGGCYW